MDFNKMQNRVSQPGHEELADADDALAGKVDNGIRE